MNFDTPFWIYWYIYIPNYLLALVMWTCFGRFALSLFVQPQSQNFIWRFFRRLTDPVIAIIRPITPRFVIEPFLPLVAAFWLILARILLLQIAIKAFQIGT